MKMSWWRVGLAIVLILLGVAALKFGWFKAANPTSFLHYEPGSYAVRRFVDGDTIIVDMAGTDETVRFIGVDTPETHKPNTPVQCYGPAAAAYTKAGLGREGYGWSPTA